MLTTVIITVVVAAEPKEAVRIALENAIEDFNEPEFHVPHALILDHQVVTRPTNIEEVAVLEI